MAINPFRVGELQLPQPLRPVPIDFSPLQSIGEGIGQYRQQQQISSILAGATDEAGNVDPIKAATALGAAGFGAHAQRMLDTALRQKALTSEEANRTEQRRLQERGQDITAGHYKADQDLRRQELEQGRVKQQIITNPDTDEQTVLETGGPNGPRLFDLKTGTWRAYGAPAAAPVVAPTVGPRSEAPVPGASFNDRFAAVDASEPPPMAPTRVAALGDVALPSQAAPAAVAPAQRVAQAEPAAAAPRPGEPGGPPLKPDTKTTRTEFAKKIVDQQALDVQAAQVAKDLQPYYDEAIAAWQDLMKGGGIGRVVGSPVGRLGGALLSTDAEAARQRYDTAINRIKSRVSAIDFKGQGAVSNYERGLAAAQFPDLTTVDPAGQLNFLLQGRDAAQQAVETAKGSSVGQRTPLLQKEPPSISKRPPEVSSSAEVNQAVGEARDHWRSYRDNPDVTAAQRASVYRQIIEEMRRRKIPNPEVLLGR